MLDRSLGLYRDRDEEELMRRVKQIAAAMLVLCFSGALFERTILSPAKLSPLVTELHPQAATVFKDSYLLEFLE